MNGVGTVRNAAATRGIRGPEKRHVMRKRSLSGNTEAPGLEALLRRYFRAGI